MFEYKTEGRQLLVSYTLQPQVVEGGAYDIDYYLRDIHLFDWRVDAELSKTLPAGSGTRASSLTGLAVALKNRAKALSNPN